MFFAVFAFFTIIPVDGGNPAEQQTGCFTTHNQSCTFNGFSQRAAVSVCFSTISTWLFLQTHKTSLSISWEDAPSSGSHGYVTELSEDSKELAPIGEIAILPSAGQSLSNKIYAYQHRMFMQYYGFGWHIKNKSVSNSEGFCSISTGKKYMKSRLVILESNQSTWPSDMVEYNCSPLGDHQGSQPGLGNSWRLGSRAWGERSERV